MFVEQNTSIIQDEVLAHRLGLVPLRGTKEGLRWLRWRNKGVVEEGVMGDVASDFNTVVMELKLECEWKQGGQDLARRGEMDPEKLYENANGMSRISYQADAESVEARDKKKLRLEAGHSAHTLLRDMQDTSDTANIPYQSMPPTSNSPQPANKRPTIPSPPTQSSP